MYRDAECLWKINSDVYKYRYTKDGALKKNMRRNGYRWFRYS
jgi:hypothetical protein